jgi:hypothetical protein
MQLPNIIALSRFFVVNKRSWSQIEVGSGSVKPSLGITRPKPRSNPDAASRAEQCVGLIEGLYIARGSVPRNTSLAKGVN